MGCQIVTGSVTIFNCASQSLAYSTDNFIKYGNRGLKSYGYNYRLQAAHPIVEASGQGGVALLDSTTKAVVKLFNTGKDIGEVEIYPFTIASYDFSSSPSDFAMFDMDYLVMVLDKKRLGYLVITGLRKALTGEKFKDSDLKALLDPGREIRHLRGFTVQSPDGLVYLLITVEKGRTNRLVVYHLQPTEEKLTELRSKDIGDDVTAIDSDSRFIVIGQNSGDGKLRVFELQTLNEVYTLSGDSDNRKLGDRNVRILERPLGKAVAHYIFYQSYRPDGVFVNAFSVGRATIVEYNATDAQGNVQKQREIFNTGRAFSQTVKGVKDNEGLISSFSDFDARFHGGSDTILLFTKQQQDDRVEMAASCGYDQKYQFRDFRRAHEQCSACPADGFKNLFAFEP